ncbi:Uncharacterized protein HZ326_31783, partial [Fusarium oxysporum f. sp. albedinis]
MRILMITDDASRS